MDRNLTQNVSQGWKIVLWKSEMSKFAQGCPLSWDIDRCMIVMFVIMIVMTMITLMMVM